MRFKRIIAILFTILVIPQNIQAGDLWPERLVRPGDTILRDRLATAHFVRKEPVEVMAITPSEESASAKDHFNAGVALALTGRYIKASKEFRLAISNSEPGGETNLKAILQYLKMSPYNPGLELPQMEDTVFKERNPELSLVLSGYLADRGDRKGALAILENISFEDPERKVMSGILKAGHLAAEGHWEDSVKLIGRIKSSGSSTLFDLLNLTRGYHYLEGGMPDRAKTSFLSIPPSSPYAPEALFGKAWSCIKKEELPEATIILEELVDRHRYSRAARDGAVDLAIAYRELGLYDKAEAALDLHIKRLKEVKNWLLEMRDTDLLNGSDSISLLEQAIDGSVPDRDRLLKTPVFARQWMMDVAADPYVIQTTALLKGIDMMGEKAARSSARLDKERELVLKEIERVNVANSGARSTLARLEEIRNELQSIQKKMTSILQSLSLNNFANEKSTMLIHKTRELKVRLALMENSVSKAEGFTTLIGRLSESVTASREESELNQIRKHAYDGLISSRLTLRNINNGLSALEGQLWLDVKKEAVQLEKKTSLRVTSGRTRAGQASAETSKAMRLLTSRLKTLEELENLILVSRKRLDIDIPSKLKNLSEKIDKKRSARLLALAAQSAQVIREAEALALYTSADIEISRMESTVKALQEAIK